MKTEKTAIQQLIDFLEPDLKMHDFLQLPAYEKAKELLETEKQQITDALTHGNRMEFYDATETAGEQYYTSTFTTNKETLK
jgi:hypothetical protein